jgi:hypothetical protein
MRLDTVKANKEEVDRTLKEINDMGKTEDEKKEEAKKAEEKKNKETDKSKDTGQPAAFSGADGGGGYVEAEEEFFEEDDEEDFSAPISGRSRVPDSKAGTVKESARQPGKKEDASSDSSAAEQGENKEKKPLKSRSIDGWIKALGLNEGIVNKEARTKCFTPTREGEKKGYNESYAYSRYMQYLMVANLEKTASGREKAANKKFESLRKIESRIKK